MKSAAERLILEGSAAEREGRLREACELYRKAVQAAPQYAKAHLNLGAVLEALGEGEAALECYQAALACDRADSYASYNVGRLCYIRGDVPRAREFLTRALEGKPDFAEAQIVLATVHEAQGELERAAAILEQALRARPHDRGALAICGRVLGRLGRSAQAENALRRALEADPRDADAWCNLGNVLAGVHRVDEAASCYRKALALEPGIAEAHLNLGHALKDQGRNEDALAEYRAAVELAPGYAQARWSAAISQSRRHFAEGLAGLASWLEANPAVDGEQLVGVRQPFWLAYEEEPNRELLERYGRLCAELMARWYQDQRLGPRPRSADGVIRVGIVSQYFHEHSVWHALIKGWLSELDRGRFEVHAFHLGSGEDGETQYAKGAAERFAMGPRSLREWVEAILDARPDVLLYPEVGMDPTTLKLAALRLAPLQLAAWGHPETTGLPTIDYYVSASDLEPPGAPANYSEKLLPLPNLGCFLRPLTLAAAAPDPGSWGLEGERPLLICPGAVFKYAPAHDWIYAEIARRLGHCRFVFFTDRRVPSQSQALRLRLRDAFRAKGLEFEHYVTFIPWLSKAAFQGLLQRADVFLDTLGFSGFNTALQAAEYSLPIVARKGRFMRGRLASGIVERMGLAELAVQSDEDYIALAVKLARDGSYRAQVRARIAASRHVLFEDPAPIRALEAFLVAASHR